MVRLFFHIWAFTTTKICHILPNWVQNFAKYQITQEKNSKSILTLWPTWRFFAKSGHTDSCSSRRSGKAVPNTKVWVLWQRREVVRVVDGGVRCTRVPVFKLSPKSSHPSPVLTDLYHKGGRTAKEKHKLFKFLSPIFVAVNSFSKTA